MSEEHEQRIYDRCIVRVGQLEGENFELRELIADMHDLLQRMCEGRDECGKDCELWIDRSKQCELRNAEDRMMELGIEVEE